MRSLPVLVLAVLFLGLSIAPSASAHHLPWHDPHENAEPGTDLLYPALRPICAQLLADLREAGVLGDHSDARTLGYETEWMEGAPECAELRDEVQWQANAYGALGYHQYCAPPGGVNCVAVNHYACDFALLLDSGLLYWCYGGLNPTN